MNVLSLLSASQNFIDFAVEKIGSVNLNWIGKLISWLFDIFSGVSGGVIIGVVVFTLCLKTIVLPLDIYSKVKTKKQSLIMEKMRPQMEKLQKQYANDKTMYSQKVMELQKQNGYSPLGACLPMIVSLVIFIVVMRFQPIQTMQLSPLTTIWWTLITKALKFMCRLRRKIPIKSTSLSARTAVIK